MKTAKNKHTVRTGMIVQLKSGSSMMTVDRVEGDRTIKVLKLSALKVKR